MNLLSPIKEVALSVAAIFLLLFIYKGDLETKADLDLV
jgi:hypothetical protein